MVEGPKIASSAGVACLQRAGRLLFKVRNMQISRRDFIFKATTASVLTAGAANTLAQTPLVKTLNDVKPVVVASRNGLTTKSGGKLSCVETAFQKIVEGEDILDSLIAGVNILELDPTDDSVGYGGLPNADGIVQLDSCCMHGEKKQAGGVAALEGVRTPSLVAKAVMDQTDHHLLVGQGAQDFARNIGFMIEDDLNTENSRRKWLNWKRRTDPHHYLDPKKRFETGQQVALDMIREGIVSEENYYGTINCIGVSPSSKIAGVTTTSGLAWKIPGRVGDSPILGAGLYVDGDVGAAGSTGRGEANLFSLSSFAIVEAMRRNQHPKDAGMEALRRIKTNTIEDRLLNGRGEPNFNVKFYIVNRYGEFAGVSMYASSESASYAVCTESGAELAPLEPLLDRTAWD